MDFPTDKGLLVPAVTADQMREVDRVTVEVFGLQILQMMENAGRSLGEYVLDSYGPDLTTHNRSSSVWKQ